MVSNSSRSHGLVLSGKTRRTILTAVTVTTVLGIVGLAIRTRDVEAKVGQNILRDIIAQVDNVCCHDLTDQCSEEEDTFEDLHC